jgi:phage terminase large subunit GpA-like protein
MQEKTKKLFRNSLKGLAPPLSLSISQWSDSYRYLSSESSAEMGKWNTDRAPYQRKMMECITDPLVFEITVMTSSQVGKTEILLNAIGRYMHLDPCPMMVVQPTVEMAKTFSKDRVAPMVRDTPSLKKLVKDSRSRDSGNTVMQKMFPGGHITFVGANSPSALASRPIRIILADEVDRFPKSAGDEGDPLTLAEKRTTTFWNRKHIRVSTPTIKNISKIEKLYLKSSQEKWCLPCPSCGEYQPLEWDRVKWGEGIDGIVMQCEYCGALHGEREWKSKKQLNGKWIAKEPDNRHKGFHINELASPFKTWEQIKKDFYESKNDTEKLKAWTNTSMGQTWEEETGDVIDYQSLFDKRIPYAAEVPDDVLILTAGVDVQDDRLEIEVVGWGLGEKSYGIAYEKFIGNPAKDKVWDELEEYLKRDFKYIDGEKIKIINTCIDTGGHHTKRTYDFIAPRQNSLRVYGIKGRGGDGVPIINKVRKDKKNMIDLIPLGVNALKDLVYSRLKIESGPGACYFPSNLNRNYDIKYFMGLTAEAKDIKDGKIIWKKIRERNEPLDLRNYATAAFALLRINLERLAEERELNKGQEVGSYKTVKARPKRSISKGVK